jgi:hypothetical protein
MYINMSVLFSKKILYAIMNDLKSFFTVVIATKFNDGGSLNLIYSWFEIKVCKSDQYRRH